jgi:hypothetical protein
MHRPSNRVQECASNEQCKADDEDCHEGIPGGSFLSVVYAFQRSKGIQTGYKAMDHPERNNSLRLPSALLMALLIVLATGSFILWGSLDSPAVISREPKLMELYSIAGAIGAVLRSLGYVLASGSFSEREQRQWSTEASVGPILGAIAGLGGYMFVRAFLVEGQGSVNLTGQYLLSTVLGAFSLQLFGRFVERGLLRGTLSRSGILGAEVSPSVPLLARLEKMLEQRLADLTLVNYDGYVVARPRLLDNSKDYRLEVLFQPSLQYSEISEDPPNVSVSRILLEGGVDREFVAFTLSVISDYFSAVPLMLTVTVPKSRTSELSFILLKNVEKIELGSIILEIRQGSQTIQVVPVELR